MRIVWGEPCDDRSAAPPLALAREWLGHLPEAIVPTLTTMHDARYFPGNVQTRSKSEHTGGQLLLAHDFALTPASYNMMDGRPTLPTDVDTSVPAEPLSGDHYFLGSIHPHFGHALLEGLSRVWAFEAFDAAHPAGMCLIYEPWTPEFALELLARAGLPPDRLLRSAGPRVVERLHVPAPSILSHNWVSDAQIRTWTRVAETFDVPAIPDRRVYLSRRDNPARRLVQEEEIEARFAEAGFEIIQPERLSMSEQGRLARQSRVLAGCIGSQMYLAAFQRPGAHTLILAPSNFCLPDDHLIASAMGHELSVAFGGMSEYRMPQGPWSIDPDAVGALLASSLES